ncbi:MAG: hypothetical protein ACYC5F_09635 [Thermoleophilia bacterium]
MTAEQMKSWIDAASYEQLLSKWRNAAVGNPFFQGEVGEYYSKVMAEKRDALAPGEHVAASKRIGW